METTTQIAKIDPVSVKELTAYLDAMGLSAQLTDKEKVQFLEISQAFGLNPFKREIYCTKYNNQTSIIVGYETYIKRAERSGQLDGWTIETEGNAKDETLKAKITIYRKDRKHPFIHEVYYSEYVQKTKEGQITKFWQKPITMTKKVAIAQGFRLCFSDELGGIPYTAEETNTEAPTQDITHVEIKGEQKPEDAAVKLLDSSKTLEELKNNWSAIGVEMQALEVCMRAKEEMKQILSQQP